QNDPDLDGAPYAWRIDTWPAQGTGSGTGGVQFAVSTVGRTNVIVSFDQLARSQSSRNYKVQYTSDGTTFQDITGPLIVTNANSNTNLNTVSLAGLAPSATAGIRIVSIFQPAASAYHPVKAV